MTNAFTQVIQSCIDDAEFFGPQGACPASIEPGHPRLLVISGENAGGKSFFAKVMRSRLREALPHCEWIPISMTTRTSSGMHRAFMFGDESTSSTGQTSFRAVRGALTTCRGRDTPHVLLLDEPDIGLSEGYQGALGEMVEEFASNLPETTQGLVVVSHARPLIGKLMHLDPTCVRVGDDLRPTREWLKNGDLPRSIADIEALRDKALARFRAIHAAVESRKLEKAGQAPKP